MLDAFLTRRMGELFSSLNTFPEVVIMPDVKKAVVEELLGLYSRRWEEKEISLEVREAAELLGLPISKQNKPIAPSEHKKVVTWEEKEIRQAENGDGKLLGLPILTTSDLNKDNFQTNVKCDSVTNTQANISKEKANKQTMPSVLLRVKQEQSRGGKNLGNVRQAACLIRFKDQGQKNTLLDPQGPLSPNSIPCFGRLVSSRDKLDWKINKTIKPMFCLDFN